MKTDPHCTFPSITLLLVHLRIFKDGLATELLRQTCKGGLIFMCLAACVSSYIHCDKKKTLILIIIALPSDLNAKAVLLMERRYSEVRTTFFVQLFLNVKLKRQSIAARCLGPSKSE